MINPDLWLAFVVAAIIILVIPGPTIILVVSQAITHGRRSVVPLVAGVLFGDLTAMAMSFLGLGALLSASAEWFLIFKWAGALYLFYLGVRMWKKEPEPQPAAFLSAVKTGKWRLLQRAYIVTALNPKGIGFFVAFLPQFVDPTRPIFIQFGILGVTFLLLATINAAVYALFAGQVREVLKRKNVQTWFHRCGGSALIGAGIVTAGLQRSS